MNIAAGIFALLGAILTIFQGVRLNNLPVFSLYELFSMMTSGAYNPAIRRMPTSFGIAIIILVIAASIAVLGAFISLIGSKASGCFIVSALLCFGAFASVNSVKADSFIFREAALWGTFYIVAAMCSIIYKPENQNHNKYKGRQ